MVMVLFTSTYFKSFLHYETFWIYNWRGKDFPSKKKEKNKGDKKPWKLVKNHKITTLSNKISIVLHFGIYERFTFCWKKNMSLSHKLYKTVSLIIYFFCYILFPLYFHLSYRFFNNYSIVHQYNIIFIDDEGGRGK